MLIKTEFKQTVDWNARFTKATLVGASAVGAMGPVLAIYDFTEKALGSSLDIGFFPFLIQTGHMVGKVIVGWLLLGAIALFALYIFTYAAAIICAAPLSFLSDTARDRYSKKVGQYAEFTGNLFFWVVTVGTLVASIIGFIISGENLTHNQVPRYDALDWVVSILGLVLLGVAYFFVYERAKKILQKTGS